MVHAYECPRREILCRSCNEYYIITQTHECLDVIRAKMLRLHDALSPQMDKQKLRALSRIMDGLLKE